MNNAQKAANEEGKSSAGDKYETTRAMMQIERDNAAKQLDEALKLSQIIGQIDIHKSNDSISVGSLIITSKANYFIAISIGLIEVENIKSIVISPVSPIGQLFLDKKAGEKVAFGNEAILINEVY